MPEAIVSRILRLPGYGVYAWEADDATNLLMLWVRQAIFLGKSVKFLTVVSDLERGEPIWAGLERKRETLDRFFAEALPPRRRRAVRAVCVDMWESFAQSLRAHLPRARIVYAKLCAAAHNLSS